MSDELIAEIKIHLDNIGKTNKKLLKEKREILSINKSEFGCDNRGRFWMS